MIIFLLTFVSLLLAFWVLGVWVKIKFKIKYTYSEVFFASAVLAVFLAMVTFMLFGAVLITLAYGISVLITVGMVILVIQVANYVADTVSPKK